MQCLIDLDILLYEVGSLGQYLDEETDTTVMKSFDVVSKAFDEKVLEIEAECWATEPSLFFYTNNKQLYKREEKKKAKKTKRLAKQLEKAIAEEDCIAEITYLEHQLKALEPTKYVPNFRDKVAKKKVYKGNRKPNRPLHYENLVEYVLATREVIMAEGCEADDLLAVWQCKAEPLTTIICSRDKDLKIVPGMHFGWSCGYQPQFGPAQVSLVGEISLNKRRTEIKGTGLKFFYSQVLTGDKTDDYPGLPRCGAVKAFNLLEECNDEAEMFNAVIEAYKSFYGEETARDEMFEQACLAWMVQELDEEGGLVHYVMYDER
jgi:hypothetical protein